MYGLRRIALPSFLWMRASLSASLPVSLLIRPYLERDDVLYTSGGVLEVICAALVEPYDRPSAPCAAPRLQNPWQCSSNGPSNTAHCRHPVADPGIPLSPHGPSQITYLFVVVLAHGWFEDPSINKLFYNCLSLGEIFNEHHSSRKFNSFMHWPRCFS